MSPDPVTPENAGTHGQFGFYRKKVHSWVSHFTMPPGTAYESPEGLVAEDEETRIAFDSQGGVYPIRESVFRDTYERVVTRQSPTPSGSQP